MLDQLRVLCFAGTYALALLSDLARFVVRGASRPYLTVGLTALGFVVHTAYLTNLAVREGQVPLATGFDSLLVLSWLLAGIALYHLARAPRGATVGLFLLPVVVALAAAAGASGSRASWGPWSGWVAFWGSVHGVLLVLGAAATCVAFAAGLMYLVQAHRLKHKRPLRFGITLPSLEQSERLNRAAITVAFPLLTAGLLIGVALVLRRQGAVLSWTDPKVLSTLSMWLVFAGLLHARFRPAMRGRQVMLLTLVAFAFLAFAMVGVDLLGLPTAHGARDLGRAP